MASRSSLTTNSPRSAVSERSCSKQSSLRVPVEHEDLVAGDFNGCCLAPPMRATIEKHTSIIEEAVVDTDLPLPLGPTTLWSPGAVPSESADVCGFLKPPDSHERWKVRLQCAFSITHSTLGILEKDRSCHHEVLDAPGTC